MIIRYKNNKGVEVLRFYWPKTADEYAALNSDDNTELMKLIAKFISEDT